MGNWIRDLLLLGIAGALVTFIGSLIGWWREEERRLRRMLKRALDAPPEMVIVARGYGMGAGLNLDGGRIAVLWDGGDHGLVYRLDQLVGGELIVDDRVAARAFRGEPRKALDEVTAEAKRVLLRLVFDNPRDPDFELVLWPPGDVAMVHGGTAYDALQAARRWVSGVEAILRQTTPRPTGGAIAPPNHRQVQEAVKEQAVARDAPAPANKKAQAQPTLPLDPEEDDPPWDEDEEDEAGR